jgi:hypothetical protein
MASLALSFKSYWDIIKVDIVAAILHMENLRGEYANLVNSANIILIPKKPDASSVSDYRPISLIHSLSKIFLQDLGKSTVSYPARQCLQMQERLYKEKEHPRQLPACP